MSSHDTPRTLGTPCVFVAILLAMIPAFASHKGRMQVVEGRIVAYASALACINEHADWSMLIKVSHSTRNTSGYVRVNFTLPCSEEPKWLTRESGPQRFRLIRDKRYDLVLEEFVPCPDKGESSDTSTNCPVIRMWSLKPGASRQEIPFGQRVPAYQSADLPQVPDV